MERVTGGPVTGPAWIPEEPNAMPYSKHANAALVAALLLAATAVALLGQNAAPSLPDEAAKLVALLESNAPVYDKAMACRRLAVIGDKSAVPALASLLTDEKLATYARSGLEAIPGPAADDALREAVGRLHGELLLGVLDSIGKRRDPRAVGAVAQLLRSEEGRVAETAARTLGYVGTAEAAGVLRDALNEGPANLRPAVGTACLICAEKLEQQGDRRLALALCEAVRQTPVPKPIALAATHRAILARGREGLPLLAALLDSVDEDRFRLGLQVARELGAEACGTLTARFADRSAPRQALLIAAMSDVAPSAAVPVFIGAVAAQDPDVQRAAIGALGHVDSVAAVRPLIQALAPDNEDLRAAARASLRSLHARGAEAALLAGMKAADGEVRVELIGVLADRRYAAATDALLTEAGSPDENVAAAAFRALGDLAAPTHLPALVKLLLATNSDAVAVQAEAAVAAVAARLADPERRADSVLAALPSTDKPAARAALIRVLGGIGGQGAFAAIGAALGAADTEVKDAALRAMADWPDARAAQPLLSVVKSATDETHRTLALRGYVRLVRLTEDDDATATVRAYADVLALARNLEAKKLVLGGLADVAHPQALKLACEQLDDAAVRAEAAVAVVKIARATATTDPLGARAALGEVLETSPDQPVAAEARKILEQLGGPLESPAPASRLTKLFDGKTFAGWEGNLEWFRIEDGAIVGGSLTREIPRNEFLCTTREYANFELRLEVKLVANKGNAGIQIRSQRIPNHHEVVGYQADVAEGMWGSLYDESRRRKSLADPAPKVLAEVLKPTDWNEYVIRCEGKRIQLWLNGHQTVDYTEPDEEIPQTGLIGLQIHGGPASEVWCRDLEIAELP